MGCIELKWYGYLMSQIYGNMLVVAFFVIMSSYEYYQYSYNKERAVEKR